MTAIKFMKILAFIFVVGVMGGCVAVGDLKEETHTVELGDIETAEIKLRMGQGELRLEGGANELIEGTFLYNVKRWKPDLDYSEFGGKGSLAIRQGKRSGIPIGKTRNRWDISLNNDIPLDLIVDFGAGKGVLDLRGLDLESLEIDMGVGDLTVDLSGDLEQDLDVSIDGGIGSAKLYLPENIGVRVNVDKGIGSVHARGMTKRGNSYTNGAYGKTEITIDVEIDAGIGSIDLRLK